MTTGAAWNVDDPAKPFVLFDLNADIVFPIGVDDWLAELGTTYASHTIIPDSQLLIVSAGTYASGTIPVRVKRDTAATYKAGAKYGFTMRIVGADGQTDDRTFRLKFVER